MTPPWPVLPFAAGGTLVELLPDVAFRIHPLTETDVNDIIQQTRECLAEENLRENAVRMPLSLDDLPVGVRTSIATGRCVLFLGAGIGSCVFDENGAELPDSARLASELAAHFSIDTQGSTDLAMVAQLVENRRGRQELDAFIAKRFAKVSPSEDLIRLTSLPWRAIFTTNYDEGIEEAYARNARISQRPVVISSTSGLSDHDSRFDVPIYHLHGLASAVARSPLIITVDDYTRYDEKRRMLFELLKLHFATGAFLYLGYSNRDQNWNSLLTSVQREFFPSSPPPSYRVLPKPDPLQTELLRAKNIITIDATVEEFSNAIRSALGDVYLAPEQLDTVRQGIPPDLLPAFEANPAATSRFLEAFTYLNQASTADESNLSEFLKGDVANWPLVNERQYFIRDLEDRVFDDMLDYATSAKPTAQSTLILGPAGYGTTTLLMALALRAVREGAGRVFFHKKGRTLTQGDLEFASTVFSERTYVVMDNAADSAHAIADVVHLLRQSKQPAFLLLGDRLNEWRVRRAPLRAKEYLLDPLSEGEIERLLDFLAEHDALGDLRDLSRDMQTAVVRKRHDKQLLVVMREATEGKGRGFDAIIEDEFRSLGTDSAQNAYLTVCCFFHLRVPVRDQLLAKLVGCSLAELYQQTGVATEGVVQYDCINETRGEYAARARHQLIAEIVWERCASPERRDAITLEALSGLNLNYGLDARVFDAFVRSDRHVDALSTLELKTGFFETACRKDPDSPYVRQHYARMLLREEKGQLALGQIETALEKNQGLRVLHHTKGEVLQWLAVHADNVDIGRRYLLKSEAAYKQALSFSSRDAYPQQGLASLYFSWAKQIVDSSPDESADYVARAEDVIERGLLQVSDKEGLWIISSQIQHWLGDRPGALQALEKAVRSAPKGSVSRYLLAREYLRRGDITATKDVLAPLLQDNPENVRAAVLYVRALLREGADYSAAIAILKMANVYGFKDPRFVAYLGGLLVLAGELSQSSEVFSRGRSMNFSAEELRGNLYVPRDRMDAARRMTLVGTVQSVKPGYAWIAVPGFPDFFCVGTKFGELVLSRGLSVRFTPGFSARGAYVVRPVTRAVLGS